ncbi:LacI family transcriptional regulator [Salinibacterium xinjiangense]|uniref:Transcriptional regulator, LacI family n=1 Tax=Salinibacterium xinjiangense TaxID=386302 RepID=A0A2C9A289_9MICO|nr:LacI family DNA-binding transcriptional regulator [Salinibacterium xinjiangense]GGL05237.1 LacI family transcriptional regulator [Salinibacterium xinjiangense]SOE73093.1 transcriptional regulator, LacI family [Salinibacterium xinjiangense]
MPGIDQVAKLAGVSTATVSRALSGNGHVSEPTRHRVRAAALELGYVVSSNASSLATGRTRNIGVVIPFINRWYFGAVLEGAEQALLGHGYDLTLYNLSGGDDQRRSVFEHFLLRKRVDAVIAISLELTGDEVDRLMDMHKPIVGVGGSIAGVRTLSIDDAAVARLATDHLLALGHRTIAFIGGNREYDMDFHVPSQRRAGFTAALATAGIDADPELFRAADFTIPGGYAAAKQLLGNPRTRPTAIFAASDEMAIGAILAARDLGLSVPDDVSITGVDDHELAAFFGLTSIAQFPALQGRMAVDILMDQLHPDHTALASSNTPLPFELIVRSSTARPKL